MRFATATIGFLLLLVTSAGAVASDDAAWLVAPPIGKISLSSDRAARDELLQVVAAKQAKISREGWSLEVPEQASGVPAKYDLLLHRSSGCFMESQARLTIQVRDGRTRWEFCELSGIYRAERPAGDVDRLVRQLAYAFHAVEKPGKEPAEGIFYFGSIGPAPHDIEVVSRDDKAAFHLQPKYLQVDQASLGPPTDRIRNYAFAVLVEHVFDVATRECKRISKDDEAREIVRNLKATSTLTEGEKLTIRLERSLFGDMSVKHSLKEALPELHRLSLLEEERQLQISIASDPKPLILQAISQHAKDEQLAAWAVRFAEDDQHPERLQWLIEVLPRLENDAPASHRASSILFELARRTLAKEQLAPLATRFAKTKNLRQKIGLANVLLVHTQEKEYFQYLETLIRSLPPAPNADSLSPRREAANHVFRYAVRSGNQRKEARILLKQLLEEPLKKQTPDSFEMFDLVDFLGDLGTPDDVPYLAGLAETGSPYLTSSAITALAKLDAKRALELLHKRIERWNNRPADEVAYSHEIYPHFGLIIFERDAAAAPLLKTAWERLNNAVPPDTRRPIYEGYNPVHVIAFLDAKTASARAEAAIAHFGDRAHYEDRTRMQRLVDQLIAEGAAPGRCKVLLHVPEESRRGR